jgi:hypothetical protein
MAPRSLTDIENDVDARVLKKPKELGQVPLLIAQCEDRRDVRHAWTILQASRRGQPWHLCKTRPSVATSTRTTHG